jgi:hypothetical protein
MGIINSLECTVPVQGNTATLNILAQLNENNELVSMEEIATINGENGNSQNTTDSITITVTSQETTPPPLSEFNRPSICNAPSGNIANPSIPPYPLSQDTQ